MEKNLRLTIFKDEISEITWLEYCDALLIKNEDLGDCIGITLEVKRVLEYLSPGFDGQEYVRASLIPGWRKPWKKGE